MRLSAALVLAAGIALAGAAAAQIPMGERRSGFDFMSRESQALQQDDAANPGMLFVLQGEALWNEVPAGGRSCAGCHGDGTLRGVAARYPAFAGELGRPVDLQGRINLCRERRQNATPWPREGRELLSLTAYVAHQSRGLPIAPPDDPRLTPYREEGRRLYEARLGQLGLSCAGCHDLNWGRRLGSSPIPQAHPTGYPIYRLEWQDLGSLQRRLRNCLIGVRAEPFPYGAQEYLDLELFLMSRAAGMAVETPGVRP